MREKLIEILRRTRYEYRRYIGIKDMEKRLAKTDEEFLAIDDSIVGEIPFCADNLIANGVTIPNRCKTCKHWIYTGGGMGDCTNGRFHLPGHPDPTMEPDGYCHLWEGKAEEPPKEE